MILGKTEFNPRLIYRGTQSRCLVNLLYFLCTPVLAFIVVYCDLYGKDKNVLYPGEKIDVTFFLQLFEEYQHCILEDNSSFTSSLYLRPADVHTLKVSKQSYYSKALVISTAPLDTELFKVSLLGLNFSTVIGQLLRFLFYHQPGGHNYQITFLTWN